MVLGLWCLVWLAIFPLLVVSDADNGRLGHDLAAVWLPEFSLGLLGAVVCLVFAFNQRAQARLGNRVLLAPAMAAAALVVATLLVRLANG